MVNSSSKGSSFERKIAKLFSENFRSYLGYDGFVRNRGSGSFFGGKNSYRADGLCDDLIYCGDIMAPKNFKYNVEVKHYKEPPSFSSTIKGSIAEWDKWISQSEHDSDVSKKEPLIIVKYNLVPEVVLIKKEDRETMGLSSIIEYKNYSVITLESFLKSDPSLFFRKLV